MPGDTHRAHVTSQAAESARLGGVGLWRLMNAPKRVETGGMRASCALFLVAYALITVVRYEESRQAFLWSRLFVCCYAALGVWLAGRVTWGRARAYTIGLAFVLPLQAAYVDGMLGNHVGEVAVTALATFAPLVFMQTAWDLLLVDVGLVVGHVLVLTVVPDPAVPFSVVGIMLGGALSTGTAASLHTLIYRARWADSLAQLERALAVSAEWRNRYEAASLASGQILYDWDARTDAVSFGGACERILGYSGEELAGDLAKWVALIHPDDREAFEREVERTVAEKVPFHLQYRLQRKDGTYVVGEDNGHFVFDQTGGIVRLVGFVSDVTERAMAEAARAEEAATSAALARVGRELISSLETPVVLDRLCRLTTEVLGCDFSQTWLWRPDEGIYTPIANHGLPADEWEALRVLRLPSDPATPLFARLAYDASVQVTPASAEFPITANMLAYYGVSRVLCIGLRRGGEVVGIHAAGYRTRREAFAPAQERLAHGIAQLASMALTNARLVEEIERASRLKSEFVSTMSHELRTPLNVILGYTDMLADQLGSGEQAALLAGVRQSSLELLEMIEATLNLNRLATGKDLPQLEPVALAELWAELRTEFATLARKPQVALRWEVDGIETLVSDRRKLKMIVKNLVGNALKFTSAGEVVARCARHGDGAAIVVHDTGIGISAEHLPHIFEMFRQVDSSDRRSYNGAGLGLYIVHQLVDQLGGTITVESQPERGSAFTVVFPDGAAPASAAA
jgi:PAS domain S-box-containing protein